MATTGDRGDVGSREVPPLRRPPFGSAGRRLREQGAAQADMYRYQQLEAALDDAPEIREEAIDA